MAKRVWNSESVSIILLPSGDQGNQLLDLAQEWSKSWLLTPALWMLADEIPEIRSDTSEQLPVPPTLFAYLLGRNSDGESVKEKVDVFWTLNSQTFTKIRFIAVRTEQDVELMNKTNASAISAAEFFERSVPEPIDKSKDKIEGTHFLKINLIVAPTNERKLLKGILSKFWDANLIAAAEDRTTPLSTDSFVKPNERYLGFVLAHIATTAGLWAGLPVSSAEISSESTSINQLGQARLQRVFVRAVTSDALSAEIAQWALQKLNSADGDFQVGYVENSNVRTIAADAELQMINDLVQYILEGPKDESGKSVEHFLYEEIEDLQYQEPIISWSQRILMLIREMAEGLAAIPRWIKESWNYRLERAINEVDNPEILYSAIPKRLAPTIQLPAVNTLLESVKPKLSMPSPALWKHLREAISAAIDAPSTNHPRVLQDERGQLLIFAELDSVLPSPDALWSPEGFMSGTNVDLKAVGWLDAQEYRENEEGITNRLNELTPVLIDARQQLNETQRLVDESRAALDQINAEVALTDEELVQDKELESEMRENHLHDLPEDMVGPHREYEDKDDGGDDDGEMVPKQ